MAIEERRALARDLDHLKRFPNDPRNAEILKTSGRDRGKKEKRFGEETTRRGDEALAKGEVEKAMFYYEMASFIEPESKSHREGLYKKPPSSSGTAGGKKERACFRLSRALSPVTKSRM